MAGLSVGRRKKKDFNQPHTMMYPHSASTVGFRLGWQHCHYEGTDGLNSIQEVRGVILGAKFEIFRSTFFTQTSFLVVFKQLYRNSTNVTPKQKQTKKYKCPGCQQSVYRICPHIDCEFLPFFVQLWFIGFSVYELIFFPLGRFPQAQISIGPFKAPQEPWRYL